MVLVEDASVICSNCGESSPANIRFCRVCGHSLRSYGLAYSRGGGMVANSVSEVPCPNCQAGMPIGLKFCGACGQSLRNQVGSPLSPPPPPPPKLRNQLVGSEMSPSAGVGKADLSADETSKGRSCPQTKTAETIGPATIEVHPPADEVSLGISKEPRLSCGERPIAESIPGPAGEVPQRSRNKRKPTATKLKWLKRRGLRRIGRLTFPRKMLQIGGIAFLGAAVLLIPFAYLEKRPASNMTTLPSNTDTQGPSDRVTNDPSDSDVSANTASNRIEKMTDTNGVGNTTRPTRVEPSPNERTDSRRTNARDVSPTDGGEMSTKGASSSNSRFQETVERNGWTPKGRDIYEGKDRSTFRVTPSADGKGIVISPAGQRPVRQPQSQGSPSRPEIEQH